MSSEVIDKEKELQEESQIELQKENQQDQEEDKENGDSADAQHQGYTNIIDPGTDRPDAPMSVTKISREYNMGHKYRGKAIIFKHSKYEYGRPPARACADHDADITKEAFEILGFHVTVYSNLKKRQFINTLKQIAAASDNGDCDALVVVFMSHGFVNKDKKERLNLYDGDIETSALWKDFTPDNCPGLAGKPKLYFIQACRGEDTDQGVTLKAASKGLVVETDALAMEGSAEEEYVIPLHADFLMMWASYPGMPAFKSYQNGMNGSVFIHFLAKVLKEDHQNDDLATMLLNVTREVAVQYDSYIPRNKTLHNKKQIPYTVSTLMRKVQFKVK